MTYKKITIDDKDYNLVPVDSPCDLKPVHAGYHPVTGKSIQCADRDFPAPMKYNDGNKIIAAECAGWRRPIIEELHVLYANRESIGGFVTKRGSATAHWYWSCTEHRDVPSGVYFVDFTDGRDGWDHKGGHSLSSRLIKDAA